MKKKSTKPQQKKQANQSFTEKILNFFKSKKAFFKFLGIFLLVIAIYYLSVYLFSDSIYKYYIDGTAILTATLLRIFVSGVSADGSVIGTPEYAVSISFGCEGTEPIILFIAAVIAFPVRIKLKIYGVLIGAFFLYFLNLIRIMALYFIGRSDQTLAETFHLEIFPIFFIILAFIVWSIWIKWAIKKNQQYSQS